MALQSQGLPPSGWTPANPMPMVESALYRQRLEVIAEKRRLQEQICGARRELEEEKLRVQRLKRKSLRERWLMDGTAEGPDGAEPEADPHSPQGEAQARIQHLEDSLFTLQSQLQLLQSASTGAQRKTTAWPIWRRQVSRSLSQTAMEPGLEGKEDLEKRASLPVMPAVSVPDPSTPRIPEESGEEAATSPKAPKEEEVSTADTVEANGPCLAPLPVELELTQNQVDIAEDRGPGTRDGVGSSGGLGQGSGIVKVEWDGLRFLEESSREASTYTERWTAEEKDEEMISEVIGDHQVTGDTELPEYMTQDRRVQEVEDIVLEAVRSRPITEASELPEWVTKDRGIVEVVWEGLGEIDGSNMGDSEEMGREEVAIGHPASPMLEPKEQNTGGSPELGDQGEGSFIWVERVLITEDWEEVLVEESEGITKESKEGEVREALQLGVENKGGKEQLEAEKEGGIEKHSEAEKLGSEGETEEVFQKDGEREGLLGAEEVKGEEEHLGEEAEGEEEKQVQEKEEGGEKKQLEIEEEATEEKEHGGEEKESEQLGSKEEEVEEEEEKEKEAGVEKEIPSDKDPGGEKGPDSEEKQEQEMKKATQTEEGPEPQAEEVSQAPAPEAGPPERQPLLQPATRSVNPASRPVPTYAPAQRAEHPPDSEQASGSKQTCQCCVVM
ncbi:paralemmin-3 [Monodelphis domestica]|uniref:Paralemmin 3 n=1 Tax=Monodelphis domestica TaxID=13616 RepID=F7G546_MONDO|nr:paralemmin-3 [Monodelphis domestica]